MNSSNYTILIVSPDRLILRRLTKFLEVFGYEVLQATGAREAIAAARTARPDVLILDNCRGDAADLQLAAELARLWPHEPLYRLLLSDPRVAGDVTAALEAGFDDFLTAPVVFGEVLARLRAAARTLEYERRVTEQAGIDPITGLANTTALVHELQCHGRAAKGKIGWLALIELDYFQRLTSRWGRAAADDAWRKIGQKFSALAADGELAAVLPDGRLAMFLPQRNNAAGAATCEQRLSQLAEIRFDSDAAESLAASCGVTEIEAGETLETLLPRCEKALALAEASGRGCVVTSDEVETDAADWAEFAADGKLFETTLARDVMQPCPLLLHVDETVEAAHALLLQTGLAQAPVIDAHGKLTGLATREQLAVKVRHPKPRQAPSSSSVRLVRHVMSSDVTQFDEETALAELMDYFTGEGATLAVIVRNREPRGLVHCHALAALTEKLSPQQFAAAEPKTGASTDLLVPDLALAD